MVQFKEFRVGDLFDVMNNPQLDKKHFTFSSRGEYPYFTRTENNNGILGYVEYLDEQHKIPGNSLAVGMISMQFHYMSHDYYAGQFTKTLLPKFAGFDELIALYFITELNARSAYYRGYLVREFANRVSDTLLLLPCTASGELDFKYMAKCMSELEMESIAVFESCLSEIGLDDHELNRDDEAVLAQNVRTAEFRMGDLFEKLKAPYKGSGKKQDNVSKTKNEEFSLPLINCKFGNNGVMYYGREEDFTFYENVLSIIYNGPPTEGQTYFQDKIGVYTDAYLVGLKDGRQMSREIGLYLTAAVNASIHNERDRKYSRGNKATWENKVENDIIVLPVTAAGSPDYDYMAAYIRAQQKQAIAEAVKLKDRIVTDTSKPTSKDDDEHARDDIDEEAQQQINMLDAVEAEEPPIRGLASNGFKMSGVDAVREQVLKSLEGLRVGDAVRHADIGYGKVVDMTEATITVRSGRHGDYTFTYPDVFAIGLMERA